VNILDIGGRLVLVDSSEHPTQTSLRIAFVISSMGPGGAERVAGMLASTWSTLGHAVSVVTFEPSGATPAYPLSERVSLVQLDLLSLSDGAWAALRNNLRRIRVLRKCLIRLEPDVVVSFGTETNVLTLAAGFFSRWPIVVSERIHPAYHPIGRWWWTLRRLTYFQASVVVAQTEQIASWLRLNTRSATSVIQNPIDSGKFRCRREIEPAKPRRKVLLSVGRLSFQKGFDILVEAFGEAAAHIPEWDLKIYGEGPLRSTIERCIAANKMNGRISLNGVVADIAAVYRSADAFVHAARYEGYPNVIVEALASSLPVIAIDSPGAVRDLLGAGRYGLLVEAVDPCTLGKALVSVLSNSEMLRSFSREAANAVKENELSFVAEAWLSLFREVISKFSR
jgi:GalNAc-alpha-(1->4)-GalNAc-alpha-(1->3)-diNAcBac-PP-undecaprenol alpha-1,4-N-acetyl-D-galactosaminyltransferase